MDNIFEALGFAFKGKVSNIICGGISWYLRPSPMGGENGGGGAIVLYFFIQRVQLHFP